MNGDQTRVWQSLTLYENTDLVRDLYKRKHGGSMNATKAWEVASQFAQGRQYYQSAAGAGDLVRPLILFYGTMALSRGLVPRQGQDRRRGRTRPERGRLGRP